jgi:hypothetical protein
MSKLFLAFALLIALAAVRHTIIGTNWRAWLSSRRRGTDRDDHRCNSYATGAGIQQNSPTAFLRSRGRYWQPEWPQEPQEAPWRASVMRRHDRVPWLPRVMLDVAGSSSVSAWIARSRPFDRLRRGQAARPALKDEGLFTGHAADGRQEPHWPVAHGTEEVVVVEQVHGNSVEAGRGHPCPRQSGGR